MACNKVAGCCFCGKQPSRFRCCWAFSFALLLLLLDADTYFQLSQHWHTCMYVVVLNTTMMTRTRTTTTIRCFLNAAGLERNSTPSSTPIAPLAVYSSLSSIVISVVFRSFLPSSLIRRPIWSLKNCTLIPLYTFSLPPPCPRCPSHAPACTSP